LLKLNNLKYFFLFVVNFSFAQTLTITDTLLSTTCSGTLISFDLSVPNEISLTGFDFNTGTLPEGWDSTAFTIGTPCTGERASSYNDGSPTDGSPYFWATVYNSGGQNDNNRFFNNSLGERYVETNSLDVNAGGIIDFDIRYASDDPDNRTVWNGDDAPQNCETPDNPSEQVYLQYSKNGGNWINITTWATCGDGQPNCDWYWWNKNSVSIPEAAKSANTKFRWRQPFSSNYYYDNWGLDNIDVRAAPPPASQWILDFGDGETTTINLATPSLTTSLTHLYLPSNQNNSRTISLTAVLTNGLIFTVTKTIIVPLSDNIPPSVSAPASITADTDPGDCFATILDIGLPVVLETCSVSIVSDKPLNNQYSKGLTTINWMVTDNASNSTTVTQTILVIDNEFPNLTIPVDVNSTDCSLALLAANTADNCGPTPTITKSIPDGYIFPSGQTAVIWQAEDSSSNITSKTQLITITDNTPPTATVTPITLETDVGKCFKTVNRGILMQYAADPTDNCQSSISITDNIPAQFDVGIHSVTYVFSDDTGNQTTLVQTVTIVDLSIPIITPPADINSDSCVIVLGDPTINDNCTYTISNNAPPTFPAGNTIVTWTVSDSSGNISTATQNVFFNDNTDPTIMIDSNPIVGVDPGLCTASAVDLGTEITNDDCSVASVTNNAPDTFQIGVTTVTWTVEDSSGNIAIATQTVTVIDDEKPVARGRDIVIELNRNGIATVTKDQINAGSSDNCLLESFGITKFDNNQSQNPNNPNDPVNLSAKRNSGAFLKSGILTFSCNDVGVKQVTLLATDSSGNTDEVIVNVTILSSSLCSTSTTSTPTTDPDSDGDGFLDSVDAFPNDPIEWLDTDGDNIGNNSDNDDDGDGFSDDIEIINNSDPLDDNSIPIDIDGDGLINPEDLDDDGDGFSDIIEDLVGTSPNDNNDFPLDTDNDGIINFYDDDDDNDGQLDEYENICGSDPLNFMFFSTDTDLDGLPDCIDLDDDNDGFSDEEEIFEGTLPKDKKSFPQDYDGDGIAGKRDNCFNVFNPDQLDTDEDTFGDACDNCINIFNPDQRDYDLDLIGNACDDDDDNDGQSDIVEIECNSDPLNENSLSPDYDNDGLPNCIDLDDDNDTQSDIAEINCGSDPLDENSMSPDYDNDGILDCDDNDKDNDGIIDLIDLNPFNYDEILISEFISPNGDGINDNWEIIPIERFPNNEVWIYSRAGNLLLNKKQYNNDWNGYYKGNPAPESSYLYMIDLNGDKVIDYKGWFYLTK